MSKPFFYAIPKEKLDEMDIHLLLDMLRYDSALAVPRAQIFALPRHNAASDLDSVQSILAGCYVFANDEGPHVMRWASYGVRGKDAFIDAEGHPIPKPGRGFKPVHFIVRRDDLDKYEREYITGNKPSDRDELFSLMARDHAIIQANPPDGFYEFTARHASFEAWRKAALPIHAATREHWEIRTLAKQGPVGVDVILERAKR